ncbi:TPA: hypothetical protein ACHWC7_004050 [Providencia stuartii]|uniref:hypothetical protein n=1 Tax=Proteus mirabilis TaxID=584 RepID=UPI000BA0A284|nr:hypothetical protein [Proteus mirabilis]OZS64633.1 hypothetical protein CHI96_19040 [Proteus mirabilis]OZS65158.1 hypothetical protein CHI96_16275 [Proteus mirabilis]
MKLKIIDILKCGDGFRYFLIENGTTIRWIEFNSKNEVEKSNFKKGSKAELNLAEFLHNVRRNSLLSDI